MPLPAAASAASCEDVQHRLHQRAGQERDSTAPPPKELPSFAIGHLMKRDRQAIALGAHRGMGRNVIEEGRKAGWRENTIKSFMRATDLGASFIEFDVQVTKDGVPIVWHDDCITYGDARSQHSTEIRDLTFEEFRSIGHQRAPGTLQQRKALYRRAGSDTKEWSCQDEDELPSLEEVFRFMPMHVGFNIEIKMKEDPAQESTPDEEIEFVATAILRVVDGFAKERTIVFSSFDPDLMTKLKKRQSHATMFLSNGEGEVHVDPRRTSFYAAVEWAHSNGLDGIVLHSNDLRQRQEIITEASARGLLVMTFGSDNDDHDWIVSQFCLGVHGAIVDDVAGIAQKLSQGILDFI